LYKIICDLNYEEVGLASSLLGVNDRFLHLIEDFYNVDLEYSSGVLTTSDEEKIEQIKKVIDALIKIYQENKVVEEQDVIQVLNNNFYKKYISTGIGSRKYYLRTVGQGKLYEAFENNVITFAVGPAGTGKTFLAVIYACNLLKNNDIKKIIITRPVVESGENLGFLPGDLREKIDPYLRPIYDSFEMILGSEYLGRLMEKGVIEIAPLAYMRGRTLSEACVILDEAQNTTEMQIKMFMTRLGFNSKMIITGDITQIDLPQNKKSGLKEALKIVEGIDDIAVVKMHNYDVVRHPLVARIIDAYERAK